MPGVSRMQRQRADDNGLLIECHGMIKAMIDSLNNDNLSSPSLKHELNEVLCNQYNRHCTASSQFDSHCRVWMMGKPSASKSPTMQDGGQR